MNKTALIYHEDYLLHDAGTFHPERKERLIETMKFLVTHPGCITGDIVDYLPIAQATVSQHLKVLREAGWIAGTTEGQATSYCLNEDAIAWFRTRVGEIF